MDEKCFREVFKLEAHYIQHEGYVDHRIDMNGLQNVFTMIGFQPNEKQMALFNQKFSQCGGTLNFNQFYDVFKLKRSAEFNEIDAKNAFRLLSKEYERPNYISVARVREILAEMGIKDEEIGQLTT